jgi:hypothetical protein
MTLYIGVDIHARQQTLSYLDTADGTTGQLQLQHAQDDIKRFYSQCQGEVIIGIEACGYSNWFEELMEQLGHQLLVGDAAEIRRLARRRQKNDRRDADLLLELLVHEEFPALYSLRFLYRHTLDRDCTVDHISCAGMSRRCESPTALWRWPAFDGIRLRVKDIDFACS